MSIVALLPPFIFHSLTGNYSCLVARFHLPRSIGFHMVQSYVPTILIVVISWVSFWMDVDSVPGRTTLGVTTLLTVSTKSAGMTQNFLLICFSVSFHSLSLTHFDTQLGLMALFCKDEIFFHLITL